MNERDWDARAWKSALAFCQSGSRALLRMAARNCTRSSLALRGTPPGGPNDIFIRFPDKQCGAAPLTNRDSSVTHDVRKVHSGRTYNDAMRDSQRRGKTAQQLQPLSCTAHMPQRSAPAGLQPIETLRELCAADCSAVHSVSMFKGAPKLPQSHRHASGCLQGGCT